jgi:hypothetical protein
MYIFDIFSPPTNRAEQQLTLNVGGFRIWEQDAQSKRDASILTICCECGCGCSICSGEEDMSTGSRRPKTMAVSSPSPSPPYAASTGFNLLGGFLMDDFLRETFHLLVVESFHKDLLSGSGGKNMSAGWLSLKER